LGAFNFDSIDCFRVESIDQSRRDRMGAGPKLPQSEWPRKRPLDKFWSKEFGA
jgi:hypothetical protein